MNMTDMVREAQEICEKARASVATEDCMDAAYKLCDLQVLLVRMEYEAGWDPVVRAVNGMIPKTPAEPKIGDVYSGQTTTARFDNMPNPTPTVTQDPAQTHIDAPKEWGIREEIGETGPVTGEEEPAHTSEATFGSRLSLGNILGRH